MDSLRQLNEAIALYLAEGCSLKELEVTLARIEASMPRDADLAAERLAGAAAGMLAELQLGDRTAEEFRVGLADELRVAQARLAS